MFKYLVSLQESIIKHEILHFRNRLCHSNPPLMANLKGRQMSPICVWVIKYTRLNAVVAFLV